MTDNNNYSYKEAFYEMKAACDEAMKVSRNSISIAMELRKKFEVSMTLLINCAKYIEGSIGDEDEARRVLKSLGLSTEVLKSLAD